MDMPKVKKLEWIRRPEGPGGIWQSADGVYDIEDGVLFIGHNPKGFLFKDNDEAKAAAQADYERRVLSALDLPTE